VERFAGEVPPRFQVTSAWGLIRNEKIPVLVENRMKERNTWQGKKYMG
jgi:radical SAM superfamily enzyme